MSDVISVDQMAAQVATGRARPLLPDGVPGPVQHDGQWWVVQQGHQSYEPVTDPALSGQLDEHAQRLARARQTALKGQQG